MNLNLNFLIFIFLLITIPIIQSKSGYVFIASSSKIGEIGNGTLNLTNEYKEYELSNSTLIKKYLVEFNETIKFYFEENLSFSAFIIIDNSPNENSYYLSTYNSSIWICDNGTLSFVGLVSDSVWNTNKEIPNLASVLSCNGTSITFNYTLINQ